MAQTMTFASALDAAAAAQRPGAPAMPFVPTTRRVTILDAALRAVRELGGSVTSETRTVPGIGSWAFVADADGNEVVLWEDATQIGR